MMKPKARYLILFFVLLASLGCNEQAIDSKEAAQETSQVKQKVAVKAPEKAQQVAKAIKAAPRADSLILMDFNSGDKPSNLGGDMGAWDKDPADDTQTCEVFFVGGEDALEDPDGYSLQIKYDVDSPNPAFNGFWTKLEGEDFSEFTMLTLYLKGDPEAGFTSRLKIELKDFENHAAKYLLSGITEEWKEFSIPFERFAGGHRLDWSAMNEFVIVFDDTTSRPKVGSLFLDEVRVS